MSLEMAVTAMRLRGYLPKDKQNMVRVLGMLPVDNHTSVDTITTATQGTTATSTSAPTIKTTPL